MGVDYFTGILSGGVDDYFDWTMSTYGVETSKTTFITSELPTRPLGGLMNKKVLGSYGLHTMRRIPLSTYLQHRCIHEIYRALSLRTKSGSLPAAVEALDTEIGRLFSGIPPQERANTTIVFLGDNGTPRRVTSNDSPYRGAKSSLYQGGINTPLIVTGAGVERVGISDDSLISTTDLFATISELAGQDLTELHDSTSFAAKIVDSTAPGRDFVFSEHVNGIAI